MGTHGISSTNVLTSDKSRPRISANLRIIIIIHFNYTVSDKSYKTYLTIFLLPGEVGGVLLVFKEEHFLSFGLSSVDSLDQVLCIGDTNKSSSSNVSSWLE